MTGSTSSFLAKTSVIRRSRSDAVLYVVDDYYSLDHFLYALEHVLMHRHRNDEKIESRYSMWIKLYYIYA